MNNCPFYGRHLVATPAAPHDGTPTRILLIDSQGNQCAIVTEAYAPCLFDFGRDPLIDWKLCPRANAISASL